MSSSATPRPLPTAQAACVAFDFDGTLANTTTAIFTTASHTLRAHDRPVPARDDFLPLIGLPLGDVFARLGVRAEHIPSAVAHYRASFPAGAAITLFPGVREVLAGLAARGLSLAVVSSRGRESLSSLLEQLELTDTFVEVIAAEDATQPKPAPEPLLLLAERLDLAPARILVVGDTTYDIEMGRRAGA